jgi:hypothetical protein
MEGLRTKIDGEWINQSEQNLPIRSRNGPFIIAECGVNWRDLVDADQMIKAAAEAGADACKFQAYLPFYESGKYDGAIHPRGKELNEIRLDESTARYLYWRCQQHGIEFMCTPFYPEAVAMLDPYVKRWKVRHADAGDWNIRRLCMETGKEALVSMSSLPLERLEREKILYCCPEYPPKKEITYGDVDGFDGYSCHIPCWRKPEDFLGTGLKYLEVHVRLDHYEPPHYCPIDTAVSITMSELEELCRRLKQ